MKKVIIIGSLLLTSVNLLAATDQPLQNNKPTAIKQIGAGVSWRIPPRIRINEYELQEKDRTITVKIDVDTLGQVSAVKIEQSSGLPALDEKIVREVKRAKFRPYIENGVATSFTASQPFHLALAPKQATQTNHVESEFCTLNFNSKNWQAQNSKQATSFQYQAQPQSFTIKTALLDNNKKEVEFSFQLSRKNKLSDITLIKSSGVTQIDEHVLYSIANAQITAPRKFWQWGNLKFQDEIVFWKSYCR